MSSGWLSSLYTVYTLPRERGGGGGGEGGGGGGGGGQLLQAEREREGSDRVEKQVRVGSQPTLLHVPESLLSDAIARRDISLDAF